MNNPPDFIRQFLRTVYPYRLPVSDSLCTAALSPQKKTEEGLYVEEGVTQHRLVS